MQEALTQRLATLRTEYESGMQALAEIEKKRDDLRTTLLRISGAIQVLEELLGEASPPARDG